MFFKPKHAYCLKGSEKGTYIYSHIERKTKLNAY